MSSDWSSDVCSSDLVLTKDSLIILDRINSRYVAQSYSEYKDRLPIDLGFETVQALFMNNVFVPGDYDIKKSDYKRFNWSLWTENAQSEDVFIPGETLVAKVKNDDLLNLTFLISQENRLACTLAGQRTDRYKFQWKYSVFEPVNGIEFPKVSQVNLEMDNRQLELGISWSRMTIDGGVTIDKNIPKSYKKLDIKDLAGSLLK